VTLEIAQLAGKIEGEQAAKGIDGVTGFFDRRNCSTSQLFSCYVKISATSD
jgi:hypothetical protein